MGKIVKGIGRAVSTVAPIAGLIPGVGPLVAGGLGAGGALLGGKNVLKSGLAGAAGGLGGELLGGPLSGLAGKIGGVLKQPGMLGTASGQGFDLGKILGLGTAGMGFLGQQQQRRSAQKYMNAQTDIRNQLMSKILGGQNYGLPAQTQTPNLNEQSTVTRGY